MVQVGQEQCPRAEAVRTQTQMTTGARLVIKLKKARGGGKVGAVTNSRAHAGHKENIVLLECKLSVPVFLRKARNPDFLMLNILILLNAVS